MLFQSSENQIRRERRKSFAKLLVQLMFVMTSLAFVCGAPDASGKEAINATLPDSSEAPLKFKREKIQLGNVKIEVEIADTPELASRGLMFRKSLPKNGGMLFIFEAERPLGFWMKNTYIDLDIGYFDKNLKLIEVIPMNATSKAQLEFPSYPSRRPAQFALEMNSGWFARNKIKEGDALKFLSRGFKSRDN